MPLGRGFHAKIRRLFFEDGAWKPTLAGLMSASGRQRRARLKKRPLVFAPPQCKRNPLSAAPAPLPPTTHLAHAPRMRYSTPQDGEMAEWLNAPVLKTGFRASGTGVRIPLSPPFSYFHILRDIRPCGRVLDMQHGIGFRPLRAKDFCGGGYGAQILRQDREERGLGIGDERKRSILGGIFGIRAGRACGRAAERPEDRIARPPFRTAHGFAARLRRSTSRPPEPATGSGGS